MVSFSEAAVPVSVETTTDALGLAVAAPPPEPHPDSDTGIAKHSIMAKIFFRKSNDPFHLNSFLFCQSNKEFV
jgi:hypothetical protein